MAAADAARTLVVVRHAKAQQAGASDQRRELTARGRADAVAAGAWLADRGLVPDAALVSAASRARQTWEALAQGAGWQLEATYDDGLYAADPDTVLDVLRQLPESVQTAVVVGHNPTVASLALLLDDGEGEPRATTAMAGGFPTCALASFACGRAWADLGPGAATVRSFHVARA